jgi:hypothetical protein
MTPFSIDNTLNGILCFVFLFISLRAFYLYRHMGTPRLFCLGLSTGMIALTAAADLASGVVAGIQLSTNWFLYIGQFVSFVFILLGVLYQRDDHLRRLMRCQIVISVLLLTLLFLAPFVPDVPAPLGKVLLSTLRSVICFVIFYRYVFVFMTKQTQFSFFMATTFMLLSLGYLILSPAFVLPQEYLLDNIGDVMRILGAITFFTSFAVV